MKSKKKEFKILDIKEYSKNGHGQCLITVGLDNFVGKYYMSGSFLLYGDMICTMNSTIPRTEDEVKEMYLYLDPWDARSEARRREVTFALRKCLCE